LACFNTLGAGFAFYKDKVAKMGLSRYVSFVSWFFIISAFLFSSAIGFSFSWFYGIVPSL